MIDDSSLHPLLAFADLTRVDPDSPGGVALLHRAVAVAKPTIPRAAGVSITALGDDGPTTTAATDPLAEQCDAEQYALGAGPCLEAATRRAVVLVDDLGADERWPEYGVRAAEKGARSSLSVPLQVSPVPAAINIYATEPKAFDRWAVVVAEALATYAAVGYANNDAFARTAVQVVQMREAMTSRAVIEQAKGMLMLERGFTAEDAFDVLVRESMTTNRKLRDVATELVELSQRRSGGSAAE